MRPLQLTLTNFGPYVHETIDFEALAKTSLFLITGKTGSGKTTIFDGLTYALYGKGTSDRTIESMRADFAAVTAATQVSLTFEHQGKRYEITRTPKQVLQKKRGHGTKEATAKVILRIFQDGTQIDELTKAKEIDPKIYEILQLNREQFVQIILLPQGDFRQFLTASSEDKEKILRKIFKTQLYQRWCEQLVTQLKQRRNQGKAQQMAIETNLAQIKWTTTPAEDGSISDKVQHLTAQQQQAEQILDASQEAIDEVRKDREKQKATLQTAETTNQQIQKIATLKQDLAELQQQAATIDESQQKVAALKWASGLAADYQQYKMSEKKAARLKAQLSDKQRVIEDVQVKMKQQQVVVNTLADQEAAQTQRQAQLTLEKNQQSQYEIVAKVAQQVQQAKAQAQALTVECETYKQQIEAGTQQIEALSSKIAQIPELQLQKNELAHTQEKFAQWRTTCAKLQQQQVALLALEQENGALEKRVQTLNIKVQKAEENKKTLQDQRLRNHIAVLVQQLEPGGPCPICGSTDHPHPALATAETVVTDAQVQAAEAQYADLSKRLATDKVTLNQQRQQAQTDKKTLEESQETLTKALPAKTPLTTLKAQATFITAQQTSLQQQQTDLENELADCKAAEKQRSDWQRELDKAMATQKKLQDDWTTAREKAQNLTTEWETLKKALPEELADLPALQADIKKLTQAIKDFETRQRKNQETLQRQKTQLAQAETQVKGLETQSSENTENQRALKKKLARTLVAHFGSEDWTAFEVLLTQQDQAAILETQIKQYSDAQTKLNSQLETYQELVQDKKPVATNALKEAIEAASQKLQTLQTEYNAENKTYLLNQSALDQIQENLKEIGAQAQALHELQQLVEIVRGGSEAKLGLERYVLQAYLLEILTVANSHLHQLSSGRYALMVHKAAGSYAKNTGLEIDVYDDNVGKARSVHTLSGGESFIAALSLALALGEVIQNQAGGITVDALFIDEGFGSLDQESLRTAMTALRNLESRHRMIGIISHVSELKNEIPSQIQVTANGQGQSKTKLIVQP